MRRIYLDNAATSWPKPDSVCEAVDAYLRDCGAPAGRGTYAEAEDVDRRVNMARGRLAQAIGAADPRRILFTANCTEALNLALLGLARRGDHVVTSVLEHNSVLRPLRHLEEQRELRVTRVACGSEGVLDPQEVLAAVTSDTRLVALVHASNVTGAVQPLVEIGAALQRMGVLFLVDAAQTLGHLPLDVKDLHADFLAAPTHKGLLGPLGGGFLYVAPGCEDELTPLHFGGTGTSSDEDRQPESLPDRFESGNLNVPAIFGALAGLEFLESQGWSGVQQHEARLIARLRECLAEIRGLRVHGAPGLGILSFTLEGYDPREIALLLDSQWRVQTRAGYHCAPLAHRALGTDQGGAVRVSVGPFNTTEDIDQLVDALRQISGAASA